MKKKNELIESLQLLKKFDWNGLLFAPTKNSLLQLGRYVLVGGSAFLVDFGAYCWLEYMGLHYLLAGVLSFIAGFLFNFLVSRWMIFRQSAASRVNVHEIISVFAISLIGLALTEGLLFVGTDFLSMDFRVSKIAASIIVLFWNYIARKVFVYK